MFIFSLVSFGILGGSELGESKKFAAYGSTHLSDFSFVAVGDWGCAANTQATLDNILDKDPDMIFGLGDYSYRPTADCWLDVIEPIKSKLKIVIGNYDSHYHTSDSESDVNGLNSTYVQTSTLLKQYMDSFDLRKQYYSFQEQNVYFIVMSTELPYEKDSEQYKFIRQAVINAGCNPEIDWIVVLSHKPFYHSCHTDAKRCLPDDLRETYHSIFDTYGVDLVLYGHHNSYERSYPLQYNTADPASPIKADTNMTKYNDPGGAIFVTVGTGGGQNLNSLRERPSYVASEYDKGYGILKIDTIQDRKTLDARFYANDGSIKDLFAITKCGNDVLGRVSVDTAKERSCTENSRLNNMTGFRPTGPYLRLNGSSFTDIPSNSSLQLQTFTLSAWFNSSLNTTENDAPNRFIISKGGIGRDTAGNNLNYGMWMAPAGKVYAGFETDNGTDYTVESPCMYNDNKWHHAAATYDGNILRLYIDGLRVKGINNLLTNSSVPENTGNHSLRVGGHAFSKNFFVGNIDEVRVWNRALTDVDILRGYLQGKFDNTGQILYLPFNTTSGANALNTPSGIGRPSIGLESQE